MVIWRGKWKAYRSELAGLLGIVTIAGILTTYHNNQAGSIRIGCDNISALEAAFDKENEPSTNVSDHDLIFAIYKLVEQSKIQ